LALIIGSAVSKLPARGLPPQNGIGNFGRISDQLYRGAQPDAAGIKNLAQLGVKTIINLRMPDDSWKDEPTQASASGILYTNVPLHGMGAPSEEQLRTLLSIINSSSGPVFVHCQHGCDRTGTLIACYRIQHDAWAAEKALEEAARYGLSRWERGMRKCIVAFKPVAPVKVAVQQ